MLQALSKVGEWVDVGNVDEVGILNGGKETVASTPNVSKEDEITRLGLPWALLYETPSVMMTFASILYMFLVMYKVQTFSKIDLIVGTPGGMTFIFLGVEFFDCSP